MSKIKKLIINQYSSGIAYLAMIFSILSIMTVALIGYFRIMLETIMAAFNQDFKILELMLLVLVTVLALGIIMVSKQWRANKAFIYVGANYSVVEPGSRRDG